MIGPFITTDFALWGNDFHMNYNFQDPFHGVFTARRSKLADSYTKAGSLAQEHVRALMNGQWEWSEATEDMMASRVCGRDGLMDDCFVVGRDSGPKSRPAMCKHV